MIAADEVELDDEDRRNCAFKRVLRSSCVSNVPVCLSSGQVLWHLLTDIVSLQQFRCQAHTHNNICYRRLKPRPAADDTKQEVYSGRGECDRPPVADQSQRSTTAGLTAARSEATLTSGGQPSATAQRR